MRVRSGCPALLLPPIERHLRKGTKGTATLVGTASTWAHGMLASESNGMTLTCGVVPNPIRAFTRSPHPGSTPAGAMAAALVRITSGKSTRMQARSRQEKLMSEWISAPG